MFPKRCQKPRPSLHALYISVHLAGREVNSRQHNLVAITAEAGPEIANVSRVWQHQTKSPLVPIALVNGRLMFIIMNRYKTYNTLIIKVIN
jgi:hypothetical protein